MLSSRYRARGHVTTQVVDELTRGVNAGYLPLADCLDNNHDQPTRHNDQPTGTSAITEQR